MSLLVMALLFNQLQRTHMTLHPSLFTPIPRSLDSPSFFRHADEHRGVCGHSMLDFRYTSAHRHCNSPRESHSGASPRIQSLPGVQIKRPLCKVRQVMSAHTHTSAKKDPLGHFAKLSLQVASCRVERLMSSHAPLLAVCLG